jgi:serine/threonine-protein kinase
VLWELITNERLFGGETDSEILTRVCDCEIPDITKQRNDLPPELVRIVQRSLSPDLERRYRDAHEMLRDVRAALRACEGDDPRDGLGAVMKRYFDARIEYVRAAARGRGIDRPSERDRRSSVLELDAVARSAAEGLADPLRTPTSVIPGRSSSGLREFPEVPTALTPVTGTTKPARQWTLWVLLPLLGAAAATIAVTINRRDGEAKAATPPIESPVLAAERGNESTSAGEDTATVKWVVHTEPQGATVIIDGVRYKTTTPMTVELPRSDEPLAVRFELAGYEPRDVSLTPIASQNLPVYSLTRIEAEPASSKPTTNTNLRFVAKKPKVKPKAGTEATTPSKPGPSEATPAPAPGTPKSNPDGELAPLPDLKGGKPRAGGG